MVPPRRRGPARALPAADPPPPPSRPLRRASRLPQDQQAQQAPLAERPEQAEQPAALGSASRVIVATRPNAFFMTNMPAALPALDHPFRFLHPGQAPDSAPWASQLPQLHHHYSMHPPDYSGMLLYRPAALKYSHRQLVAEDAVLLTIAVLFGESDPRQARFGLDQRVFLNLVAYAYKAINSTVVQSPKSQIYLGPIIQVSFLAAYEASFNLDLGVCRTHLQGAKTMLSVFRGPDFHNLHQVTSHRLAWIDRLIHTWDLALEPFFAPAATSLDNPNCPILLATLPRTSQTLSQRQWRQMLIWAQWSPAAELFETLHSIQSAAELWQQSRHTESAQQSTSMTIKSLRDLESELLSRSASFFRDARIFNVDATDSSMYQAQRLTCETIRQVGLFVARAALAMVEQSDSSTDSDRLAPRVDYCIQVFFLTVDISALCSHCPHAVAWSMAIIGPYTQGHVRVRALESFREAVTKLHLYTWESTRTLLESIFYFALVQDDKTRQFYAECLGIHDYNPDLDIAESDWHGQQQQQQQQHQPFRDGNQFATVPVLPSQSVMHGPTPDADEFFVEPS